MTVGSTRKVLIAAVLALGLAPSPASAISRLSHGFAVKGSTTTVKQLTLSGLPAGATVVVRCRGTRCPISVATAEAPPSGTIAVRRMLGRAPLRAGQVLTIRVHAPGIATRVARFTIRHGQLPKGGTLARVASSSVRPHRMGY